MPIHKSFISAPVLVLKQEVSFSIVQKKLEVLLDHLIICLALKQYSVVSQVLSKLIPDEFHYPLQELELLITLLGL